jgi:hypothetical protein
MLEQLENQEGNYAIVQELLQDFELIVDSFEQAVERPRVDTPRSKDTGILHSQTRR